MLEMVPDHLYGIEVAASHWGKEYPDAMALEVLRKFGIFVAVEVVHDYYRVLLVLDPRDKGPHEEVIHILIRTSAPQAPYQPFIDRVESSENSDPAATIWV
jgi:hypothetical protein